jgi:hypothetical protein
LRDGRRRGPAESNGEAEQMFHCKSHSPTNSPTK